MSSILTGDKFLAFLRLLCGYTNLFFFSVECSGFIRDFNKLNPGSGCAGYGVGRRYVGQIFAASATQSKWSCTLILLTEYVIYACSDEKVTKLPQIMRWSRVRNCILYLEVS